MKYIAQLIDKEGFVKEVEIPEEKFHRGSLYFAPKVLHKMAQISRIEVIDPAKKDREFVREPNTTEEVTTAIFREQ